MPAQLPGRSATLIHSIHSTMQFVDILTTESYAGAGAIAGRSINTRGLSSVRFQVLLYPEFATGLSTYVARNYLSFRVLGTASPFAPAIYAGLVRSGSTYTPLTPPQIMPVGTPVSLVVDASGFDTMTLEFDTTSGTAAANQGQDYVLLTLTGSV